MKTLEINPEKESSFWSTIYVTQAEICNKLSQYPEVEALSISRNQIGERSLFERTRSMLLRQKVLPVSPSIKQIAALKNLYKLSISNGNLTNEDMACLATNPNLTSLTIVNNRQDFSQGLAAFAKHKNLSHLHLAFCDVDDAGATALKDAPLQSLNISSNTLTDEGAVQLLSNKSLVNVSVTLQKLTYNGAHKIIEALEDQHNLTSFIGLGCREGEMNRILLRNFSELSEVYVKILRNQFVDYADISPRIGALMTKAKGTDNDDIIVRVSKKIAQVTGVSSYQLLQSILRPDLFYFDVDEWLKYYQNPDVADFWSVPKGQEKAVIVLMVEKGVDTLKKAFLDNGDWLNSINKTKLKQIFSVVPQVDSYLSTLRDFNQMLAANTVCKHNSPKYIAFGQKVRS